MEAARARIGWKGTLYQQFLSQGNARTMIG